MIALCATKSSHRERDARRHSVMSNDPLRSSGLLTLWRTAARVGDCCEYCCEYRLYLGSDRRRSHISLRPATLSCKGVGKGRRDRGILGRPTRADLRLIPTGTAYADE